MLLKLKCDVCGRGLRVEGDEIPRLAWMECPHCQAQFQTPSNILSVDDVIGGFKIDRHLGSGAMGCVYQATQLSMNRKAALKVLPPELTHNEHEITEFMREVQLLAKLNHPCIVMAFEAGKDGDNYFLAMDFVDGRSLEDEIVRDGEITEKRALKIALRLAGALQYAWAEHGLLHRDIKPANIVMRDSTHPVLLDMGLSKIAGTETGRSTRGMMVGTPHYMSPEQTRDSSNVDFRADMYALGCTIYFMLTRKVPYDGPDVLSVISKHVLDEIPSPKGLNPSVSNACVKLLRRMMAKDPDDRYESWDKAKAEIQQVLSPSKRSQPSTLSQVKQTRTAVRVKKSRAALRSREATSRASKTLWSVAAILSAFLALAGVFGYMEYQSRNQKEIPVAGPPTHSENPKPAVGKRLAKPVVPPKRVDTEAPDNTLNKGRPELVEASASAGRKGNPPEKAIDGDRETCWLVPRRDLPAWFKVSLREITEVTKIKISWQWSAQRKYRVEASEDGSQWVEIVNETTQGTEGRNTDHTVKANAKFIRITFTRTRGRWVGINDLSLY